MKRILLLIVLLTVFVCLSSTRAQTIYLRSGQKIPIEGNGLHSIVPLENGYAMAFKGKDGQIMHVFHFDDLSSTKWTGTSDAVETLSSDKQMIVYLAEKKEIIIRNGVEDGDICVFSLDGSLVARGKGRSLDISTMADGLYIVSYNNVFNAKFLKK